MSEQNVFDRKTMEMNMIPETQGLLEQLNLPPALIRFLRANQKKVWAAVIVVILIVVAVSLYGSYRAYRLDKAASALDSARLSGESAITNLEKVVADYGTTPAALWARVEMVSLYEKKGDFDSAVKVLTGLESDDSVPAELKPLITYKLAALYERQEAYDKALGMYTVLSQVPGFEAEAFKAMGRVNEQLSKVDQAVAMYRKYLEQVNGDSGSGQGDPARTIIEARLNSLEIQP